MASQVSDLGEKNTEKSMEQKIVSPANPNMQATAEEVENFPDPDEDDLDDLDDFLTEFSADKTQPKKPGHAVPDSSVAQAAEVSALPNPNDEDKIASDEMAKELEKGMASFFSELESSPDMKAQFEEIFKSIAEATAEEGGTPSDPSATTSQAPAAAPADFQDTIRKTMDRMKTSENRTTEELNKEGPNDFMEDLIGMLGKADMDGEGSPEDFNKMLMGMMDQLTNKEILYEPMKELHEQFPAWLEKNKDTISSEAHNRYDEQRVIVAEIVAKFEEKTYSDDNTAHREYIVERMQKMQASGSPPPDLVGDLQASQDVLNQEMPNIEGCNPQ